MNILLEDIQIFLLNLSFVFLLYFLYHKFIERNTQRISNEIFVGLISGLSIILCMTFTLSPVSSFIFDMRQLPLIIGALYGGRRVLIFLFITLLSYRYFIGMDEGYYASVIIYSILTIILCYLIPRFTKAIKIKHKVKLAAIAASFGIVLILILIFLISPNASPIKLVSTVVLYGTQFFLILFFVTLIERARMERMIFEELKKLEKLKIVSEIAASISHEVRNPLTVTRGFIQLLRESNIPDDKKEMYIRLSLEELDRAEEIITDYLTFAKPSLENVQMLELHDELQYVLKVVSPYATMNSVNIHFKSAPNLFIAGEKQKFHQCLINLAKNAIEAMPQGGDLTVNIEQEEDKAIIRIQDSGVGMTEEQLSRLGTPYYTTKEKGTGLGTMVVFSIIKVMQGEISVNSKVGEGTCFTLVFPIVSNE
ncbi:ATP-binding protein [Alkalihalobacterium chitinilyticum]|uniref:histidine kinase n=1 Tax=Alkalihalobacterium chitinilyticum TaxID=2980103 RepID=A0ABT5VJJ3_9BACI|nr:ATP-binding protein [Alkalihalobacterium chitinilyticum]MDE5415627.1 ATP-binding protein [Alkalihalobacterium chitinilyticum]